MKAQVDFDSLGRASQYKFEFLGTPSQAKVTLGFKPKQLFIQDRYNGSQQWDEKNFYDETVSTTHVKYYDGSTSSMVEIGNNNTSVLWSIDNDGFTLGVGGSGQSISNFYNVAYLAIG